MKGEAKQCHVRATISPQHRSDKKQKRRQLVFTDTAVTPKMSWFATGPIAIEEKLAVQDIFDESRGLSRGDCTGQAFA